MQIELVRSIVFLGSCFYNQFKHIFHSIISEVAKAIEPATNPLIVRGHTDALPFSSGRTMNNWMLSTARAEATRKTLQKNGVRPKSFFKIEGVADREPYTPNDVYDPRNRRISITLGWNKSK